MNDDAPSSQVLAAWPGLSLERGRFGGGLINATFQGTLRERRVLLQRLHPVFAGSVHHDIEAVTRHLERSGMETPRLVRTRDGLLWADDERGRPVRLLTFVERARTWDRVASGALAREAGALVGRFHASTADLEHEYVHVRAGVHDTAAHFVALAAAVEELPHHPLHAEVARLAGRLWATRGEHAPVHDLPARHAHGDLKISNLLFDEGDGAGRCLVDLDTLGRMPLPFELGDALRSWCNPGGEDEDSARVDLDLLEAALAGYGRAAPEPAPEERERLGAGLFTIAAELSSRFAADALRERYFGWDPERFPTRGAHNLARARGQLALAESVRRERRAIDSIARRHASSRA